MDIAHAHRVASKCMDHTGKALTRTVTQQTSEIYSWMSGEFFFCPCLHSAMAASRGDPVEPFQLLSRKSQQLRGRYTEARSMAEMISALIGMSVWEDKWMMSIHPNTTVCTQPCHSHRLWEWWYKWQMMAKGVGMKKELQSLKQLWFLSAVWLFTMQYMYQNAF